MLTRTSAPALGAGLGVAAFSDESFGLLALRETRLKISTSASAAPIRMARRALLAGAVLTMVGIIWLDGPGGLVLLPGLWLLLSAPLIPASPKADRMRRPEVELERAVFSHPAQRRLAIQAMAAHDKRFPVTGRY